jgi:hypothetical protein
MTNYKKMRNEKLQQLLQTADEHEAIQIITVLKDRGVEPRMPEPSTAAPAAKAATEPKGEAPAPEAQTEEVEHDPKTVKKHEDALKNVGHRCEVVPFNTIEWVKGIIVGVAVDWKSNRVSYAIKTETGKTMAKSVDTKLIKILPETVDLEKEFPKRARTNNNGTGAKRTEEDLNKDIAVAVTNVGRTLQIDEDTTVIITGLLKDKRSNRIIYKFTDPNTGGQRFKSFDPELKFGDFASAEAEEAAKKYVDRFLNTEERTKVAKDPEARMAQLLKSMARYKEQLAKWETEYKELEAKGFKPKAAEPTEPVGEAPVSNAE